MFDYYNKLTHKNKPRIFGFGAMLFASIDLDVVLFQ